MSQESKSTVSAKSWLLLAGIFLFVLAPFLYWFIKSSPEIKASLIGGGAAVTAGLITHYQAKKREVEARHFEPKRAGYEQLLNLLTDLLFVEKAKSKTPSDAIEPITPDNLKKMLEFKRQLMVWGSSSLIEKWHEVELGFDSEKTDEAKILIFESLLREIRKDLGHDDGGLKIGRLWGLWLIGEDRRKLFAAVDNATEKAQK